MCDDFEVGSMTEDEDRMAVEAHFRALDILHDALNKQGCLLAVPGRDYGPQAAKVPLICPQLVENLIQTLQQAELLKYNRTKDEDGVGAIYPPSSAPVIGLCPEFWLRNENLRFCSRPGALIMAAAYILGYHDNDESLLMEENRRLVLSASDICEAFELWMRHKGKYVNGSYSCCQETSVHSVCENSDIRFYLHCIMDEEQKELAEMSRKATLKILVDALCKGLFVHDERLRNPWKPMATIPLIPEAVILQISRKLEEVTLKCDNKPRNEALIAYPGAPGQNAIYLCPLFWKQSGRLRPGSRLGTLILCTSQLLGYRHILSRISDPEEATGRPECDLLTADEICAAFEHWMRHQEPYEEGSYSCCEENDEDSVCSKSIMGSVLRECFPEEAKIADVNSDKDPTGSSSVINEVTTE